MVPHLKIDNSNYSRLPGSINTKIAIIPIPIFLVIIGLLLGLGLKEVFVFSSPLALLVVSILFYWLVTPAITYISAKGYLNTGSLTLLFISLAFFVALPFSIVSGAVASMPNLTVMFAAFGFILSSAFQLCGAAQASFGSVSVGFQNRKLRLTLALMGALILSLVLVILGFLGIFPSFFLQNSGITLVDQVVYAAVILFFALAGLLYLRLYLKSKSRTLYFYSLALILYAIGSFGITQQVTFGDAVVWVGRIATYFGLIYFLYALIGSQRQNS